MNAATSMIENPNESGSLASAPPTLLTSEAQHLSAGTLLRQAREAQSVRPDALAAALKVPVQKIEALENDALDLLPDAVFARALAASICRALRVDPAPVLARLPGASMTGLAQADKTINAGFSGGSERTGRGPWRSSRGLVAVIVLLLVGAVVLYFMPQSALNTLSASWQKAIQRGPETSDSTAAAAATGTTPASPSEGAGVPGSTVAEPVSAEAPMAPTPAASPASTVGAIAALPVASAAGALAAGTQPLIFTARGESWITVTDSRGVVLLKRIVAAGETVGVSGSLPLSVIVGRAPNVDVQVRGQAFDLKPVMGAGGVARFSVKP